MRVILHIGMPKTGTTALQTRLARNSVALRRHGILYPRVESNISHQFLSLPLRERTGLPRELRDIYEGRPDLIQRDFQRDWDRVQRQIERYRPHTLILSSERLLWVSDMERAEAFRDRLRQLSEDILVVAYVRQPSSRYLSGVQQTLKGTGTFRPPSPIRFREQLERYETLYPGQLRVAAFEREQMRDGDIVADFAGRFLPPEALGLLSEKQRVVENETVSAEAMAIMQDYHQVNRPGMGFGLQWETTVFWRRLRLAERRYGFFTRPRLKPEVAEFIDRASVDQLWLRDTHGIVFPKINYDTIAGTDANPYGEVKRVDEVCVVDEAVKREILMRMLKDGHRSWLHVSPAWFALLKRHGGNSLFLKARALGARWGMR